jgi:hypothetical protein
MSEVLHETLKNAHKPYDIVTDESGNVGFIRETSVNEGQTTPDAQIGYAVEWIIGEGIKSAWYKHSDLKKHCNLFVKIAECSCHPFGNNRSKVKKIMGAGFNIQK